MNLLLLDGLFFGDHRIDYGDHIEDEFFCLFGKFPEFAETVPVDGVPTLKELSAKYTDLDDWEREVTCKRDKCTVGVVEWDCAFLWCQ